MSTTIIERIESPHRKPAQMEDYVSRLTQLPIATNDSPEIAARREYLRFDNEDFEDMQLYVDGGVR